MESLILKNLNSEQYEPAKTIDGAVLVTAGAGSGKTRMLTHRIAHMVDEIGISPFKILAIPFTNKAANEMKERLSRMVEKATDHMWICTFHSMCAKILRFSIEKLGYTKSFSIYGDTEKNRVIKRIMEEIKTDITPETFAWHISNAKNNLLSPESYSQFIRDPKKCKIITGVYEKYEEELKKANALDFDDLLMKTYELLKSSKEDLEYYQEKFKYIYVDEFQDTNTAQYELVKLLADKYKNILVVGDEDQCIYSWRGAQVENVLQFTKDFKDCKVFKLEQNYRSTKKIISLANKLIKNNQNRIVKNLWTANDDGSDVELKQTYSDMDEAEFVANKIEELVTGAGAKYSDFAILMRVNSQSRVLEEKLLMYNIPHKIYGGFKFYERKEIKDTTAYLYLVANPNDTEATNRMLAFPKKGIGEVSIAQIHEIANKFNVSQMEVICNARVYGITGSLANKLDAVRDLFDTLNRKKETLSLVDFVTEMIELVGIKQAIGNKTEEDLNKCMNVDDLIKSVTEFAEANEGATIDDFLQSVTLMRDIDSMNEEDDFVSLMTVHSAKGLEFNGVFLVGLNDGLFPLSRAINSADPNELEEERRLMYVAVTRAKKKLFISRSKTKFDYKTKQSSYTAISRFLQEMFDNLKDTKIVNGSIQRSSIYGTDFEEYLNKNKRSESLDEKMSRSANFSHGSSGYSNSYGNQSGYGSKGYGSGSYGSQSGYGSSYGSGYGSSSYGGYGSSGSSSSSGSYGFSSGYNPYGGGYGKSSSGSYNPYGNGYGSGAGSSVSGYSAGSVQNLGSGNQISPKDYNKFKKGTKVKHKNFGEGVVTVGVTDFASAFVTINFSSVGIKTLSLKYAKLEIIE